jgi:SmpA / OmlA family
MKKRTALCLAVTSLACVGVVLAVRILRFEPGVSKANFDRVEVGMTKADVDAILGSPHVSVDVIPYTYAPVSGAGTELCGTEPVWEHWHAQDRSVRIVIEFVDELVVDASWHGPKETLIDKLRRWLHLP